ncbi:MAG: hypothetical protein Q8P95_01795, partial [bacterium]|nr:hypothetical protein [bacterium]
DISQKSKHLRRENVIASAPQRREQRQEKQRWAELFLINTLRKKTTIVFTVLAIAFFAAVVYIAIPSATISLSPATNVIDKTINITLANPNTQQAVFRNPNANVIPSIPIEMEFERSISYPTTGKVFTGSLSRCNLKVTNERNTPWTLIPKTRFQDPSGVVFRTDEQVVVPAARFEVLRDEQGVARSKKAPGTLVVSVVADEFDAFGNIIGARGNLIADTKFILPALSKFNQGLIFASNERACRGGVTASYQKVMAEDVAAAQKKIREELETAALQYLADYVEGENVKRAKSPEQYPYGSRLVFFNNSRAIQYNVSEITLPENIEGQKANEFTVAGKMKVKGIAYEQHLYTDLLEQGLLSKVHPSKVLSSIEFNSTTQSIVFSDSDLETLDKIKLGITVRGLEEYNFDPRSPQGKEVVDRILDYVPGKTKSDALYFVNNLEPIQKAEVTLWPFWSQTMPGRKSSISIRVN